MAEKDIQQKILEDFPDVFADIINVIGFQGERLLDPEQLVAGPTASIYKASTGENREQFRDVSKYSKQFGACLTLLGLENQTTIDYDMVFRIMRYDGAAYKMQSKKRRKAPVATWVLYFGLERWNAPKSIHEAMIKGFPNWKKVLRVLPNYQINLVEVAFLPENVRKMFTSDFRLVAEYFHGLRTNDLDRFYNSPEGTRKIQHVEAMMEFLKTFSNDTRFEDMESVLVAEDEKGADITMCKFLDHAENKGIQKGISKGINKGVRKTNRLITILADQGRIDDLIHAAKDPNYQNQLFKEFGIRS